MDWLSRYGRRLGHRSPGWAALNGLAVAVFVLAWCGLILAAATYDGREVRTEARTPQEATDTSSIAFRYSPSPRMSGLEQVWVMYVRPLTPDAPPPPGVNRWPAPGESVVSPATAALLAEPGSWSSWSPGRVVGTIGPEGLSTAAEPFAYVNPPAHAELTDDWVPASRFGGSGSAGLGEVNSVYEWPLFVVLYGPAVVLPATLLLAGTWLAGSARRRRTERTLVLLGAGAAQRGMLRTFPVLGPWALGATGAAAALAVGALTDIPFPFVDFELQSVDVRRWALPLALTWLATSLGSLTLLQFRGPANQLIRKTRNDRPGVVRWLIAAVSLFAVAGALPMIGWLDLAGTDAGGYATMIALVVVVLTMPTLCDVTIHLTARLLRGHGGVGAVVGVGLLRQGRGPVSALAGTFGSALCLLWVANIYVTGFGQEGPDERAYAESLGQVVIVAGDDLTLLTERRWTALTEEADRVVLSVLDDDANSGQGGPVERLYADPASLRGVPGVGGCEYSAATPVALRHALRDMGDVICPQPLTDRPARGSGWKLILYRSDGQLCPGAVADQMATWLAPPPVVSVPGTYGLATGPTSSAGQIRWISWCAAIGLLLMIGALLQFSAGDLQQARRRIAGYLILGANESVAWCAMAVRLGVPVVIALSYSLMFTLQRPMWRADQDVGFAFEPFVIYAAVLVIGIAAAIALNARGAIRHLRTWRPGRGRE